GIWDTIKSMGKVFAGKILQNL
uniref:Brevinin-2-related peptide n=1 Tax=Lithobates septentrionalis TaxID=190274 RepID=BR2RP_LITST|nr:RecName: Full=Brevinin-2-related peptide [Lithobates septentrionalis]